MESLIKLTVKTPNQHIEDIQIDCDLQWTVRKLKEYLQDVYPSNPASNTQKLIYLGKLLQDHHLLKEVFGDWGAKTLHIVCSETSLTGALASKMTSVPSPLVNPPVVTQNNSTTSTLQNDGVRYRGTATTSQQNLQSVSDIANWYQSQLQVNPWAVHQQYQTQMQQYYQHMQQWQHAMINGQWSHQVSTFSNPPSPSVSADSPISPQIQQPPQLAQPQAQQPAQRQNQDAQLNAGPGGGIMPDDDGDDENPRNRDWLDWLYMSMRALMLMSIVYFYSSTSRFLMVSVLGFIIYLYQGGWFTPRRIQQPDLADEPQENINEQNENNNFETPDNINEQQEPVRPGVFKVLCTFCVSFITSLVPTGPPAMQEN